MRRFPETRDRIGADWSIQQCSCQKRLPCCLRAPSGALSCASGRKWLSMRAYLLAYSQHYTKKTS